jgi:hypothetical protein
MSTIDHGIWSRYTPRPFPEGYPANALFCHNDAGLDWYEAVQGDAFEKASIKMTVYNDVVQAVERDASRMFPPDFRVVEVTDDPVADPFAKYHGKIYDPATKTFSDPPPPPEPVDFPDIIKRLQARIEALETK